LGYLEVLARSLYCSSGRNRADFVVCVGVVAPSVSDVFLETYVQAVARLAYIR